MNNYKKTTFEHTIVHIDNSSFAECEFKNCTMVFAGSPAVNFTNCKFIDVKWQFTGAAANTITFLKVLGQSMGKSGNDIVKKLFSDILGVKVEDITPIHQ